MKPLLLALAFSSLAATAPALDITVSDEVKHGGAQDGSAGVAIGGNQFIGATDENNILRLYSSDSPEAGKDLLDLNPLLGFEKEDGEFKECDIEGAARMGDIVFWIGSHGLNKKGHVKANRRVLFATRVTPAGQPVQLKLEGQPCKTLMDAFVKIPELAAAASIKPEEPGGLNIEAICVQGETLLIGFRNPVSSKGALIVPLTNPLKVIAGEKPILGQSFRVDLQGRGIRDMVPWNVKQILIVGGDFQDRSAPNARTPMLFLWDGSPQGVPIPIQGDLGTLNPEAALVYPSGDKPKLQLLSDDGGDSFRSVRIKINGAP
jgi:hypothetical protein